MKLFDLSRCFCIALTALVLTGTSCRPATQVLPVSSQSVQSVVPVVPKTPQPPPIAANTPIALPRACQGQILRERPAHFDRKMIAFTFDDGPDPLCTPQVLDALAKYHAHATFFVVGKEIPGREALLQRMIAEGHVVGNHTYTHPSNPSAGHAGTELSRTETLITRVTGRASTCFRPPYGRTDTVLVAQAKRHGYGIFLWTVDPGDSQGSGTRKIIRQVLRAPQNGDIVILHDGNNHQASVAAVPPILKALSADGWQFVTLPEMMVAWAAFRKCHALSPKSHRPGAHKPKHRIHKASTGHRRKVP